MRQSVYEIGSSAAQAIVDMLAGKLPPAKVIGAEIIVRESTRIYRR